MVLAHNNRSILHGLSHRLERGSWARGEAHGRLAQSMKVLCKLEPGKGGQSWLDSRVACET